MTRTRAKNFGWIVCALAAVVAAIALLPGSMCACTFRRLSEERWRSVEPVVEHVARAQESYHLLNRRYASRAADLPALPPGWESEVTAASATTYAMTVAWDGGAVCLVMREQTLMPFRRPVTIRCNQAQRPQTRFRPGPATAGRRALGGDCGACGLSGPETLPAR